MAKSLSKKELEVEIARMRDPARGFFDVQNPQEPESRHKNKTAQDRMKPEDRDRVLEWQERRNK